MKTIQSAGGPLLALPSGSVQLWGGIDATTFTDAGSGFTNDYEMAGFFTTGVHRPPCEIAILQGSTTSGLLLSSPLETCILRSSPSLVQIAQVHYACEGWSFSDIDLSMFDKHECLERVEFVSGGGTYVLFDAACPGQDVGSEDHLVFELNPSLYVFSAKLLEENSYLLGLINISNDM